MLPLHLTLKNFMSYGEEPTEIDFRGMNVICLSGDNGHGKSALLDAITWALWGETRLGKQNHDQLIRLGADEMSVVLEFQEGGETYRVRRQRSKKSSGQLWEMQIQEAGGSWRPITGQGSGDTGRAIVQLLRMSYETFLNSAYLRQGRADEFVRQTANKRKEILAEILDLSRYDDLEARARLKMREASDRALDESRAIQQIDAEIGQEDSFCASLDQTVQQLAELTERQQQLAVKSDALTELRATLTAQRRKLEDAEQQIKNFDQQLRRQQEQLEAERAIIEDSQKLLDDRKRIELDYDRYEAAQARVEQLQTDAQRFRELDRRRVELEHQVQSAQREIEIGLRSAERERDELARSLAELPQLQDKITSLQASQAQYQALAKRRELLWEDQKKLTTRFADLAADKKRCDADLAAAQQRMDSIAAQTEACSICGSPLPQEKLDALAEEVAQSISYLEQRNANLKRDGIAVRSEIKHIEEELATAEEEMKRLEKRRDELSALQQRFTDLDKQRSERLPEIEKRIATLSGDLSAGRFAPEAKAALSELIPALEASRDAEKSLGDTMRELQSLRWVEKAHAQLQSAARELTAAQGRREAAQQLIEGISTQRTALAQSLEEAPALDRQIAANARELDEARYQLRSLGEETQKAQREQGRLQHLIERCRSMRVQRAEREAALQTAKNEEDLYTMLAGSFGKRGVQALIIENALPELENDANELLERLTDGEMSITIQTTRQAKGRNADDAPIETLDISIGDHLGSRPLEMYSGGESFRVSFALRIALSKLLVRRAGAHLQTLIIDEGFGTQDAKGREKLVDSIMAIQSEFAQIIVITHVDELKDAFPNRIEVCKTPTGSEVTVVNGAALG